MASIFALKLLLCQDPNFIITKASLILCFWVLVMQNINLYGWILSNMVCISSNAFDYLNM